MATVSVERKYTVALTQREVEVLLVSLRRFTRDDRKTVNEANWPESFNLAESLIAQLEDS